MKKVQLVIFSLLAVAISACGKAPILEVDAELSSYVTSFEAESVEAGGRPVRVHNLIAKFGELDNAKSNGICELREGETPKIIISRAKWNKMSPERREGLMFHELGHCVLGREHIADTIENGVPASLMNPYSIDTYTYSEYRRYYLKELFTGKGDPSLEAPVVNQTQQGHTHG